MTTFEAPAGTVSVPEPEVCVTVLGVKLDVLVSDQFTVLVLTLVTPSEIVQNIVPELVEF